MSVALTHKPADVIRWLLVQTNLATDPGDGTAAPAGAWPAYEGLEPSTPDNCVTCYDTAGRSDGVDMQTGEQWMRFGVQIRVRGRDGPTAFAKAEAIRHALNETIYLAKVRVPPAAPGGQADYFVQRVSVPAGLIDLYKNVPGTKRNVFLINCVAPVRAC